MRLRTLNMWDVVAALAALAVLVGVLLLVMGVTPIDPPCFGSSSICLW